MDNKANEDDLICNVAHQLRLWGGDIMLDGIGYVKYHGRIAGEPYSGIEVEDDNPVYNYEID